MSLTLALALKDPILVVALIILAGVAIALLPMDKTMRTLAIVVVVFAVLIWLLYYLKQL